MSGSQGSKNDDKRSILRRVCGAPGEEKAVQMPDTNELLLAHHEERHGKICKKNATAAKYSTGQLDLHSSAELT